MLFVVFSILDQPEDERDFLSFIEGRKTAENGTTVEFLRNRFPNLVTWDAMSTEIMDALNSGILRSCI
ncbi:MAG: hypothetical protein HeimC3_33850 [Candidatus Heimdallarchaeota archaeon LC_3]|nr:MAG: hypothetical protein HeimC3_33850 [Candidatus Heimdallarchaeota archaeon LC_3]